MPSCCQNRFQEQTKRKAKAISNQTSTIYSDKISKIKKLNTKIHFFQKNLVEFIKKHRTIKLLHILRNYSALVVVISSALLVSSSNLASHAQNDGFLFGYWKSKNSKKNSQNERLASQTTRKDDLAFVPLAQASTAVDPDFKEEDEATNLIQDQALLSISAAPMKEPEEDGGVKIYEVQPGDTVSSIAASFNITTNTILWANEIEDVDAIKPGDRIFILPVSGISYTIKKDDTLDSIAEKYKADKEKIISFNDLPANGKVEDGQEIIIPGGQKEIQRPRNVESDNSSDYRRQYATPEGGSPSDSGWKKLDGKAGTGHKFPYGYCTWYVAQKRYVPWGGNAGTWLYRAKSMGYKTGKTPQKGAIMVTSESWWGHVAIVEKVGNGTITVSEMNYKGWSIKSTRTLSTSSRVIKGYIY